MAKTAGPIGSKLCAHYADGSGNGHMFKNIGPVRHKGEHFNMVLNRAIFGVLGRQHFIKSLDVICTKNTIISLETIECINR